MKSKPGDETKLECLARAFVSRTLPKQDWTHEAHLRVGLWHLLRHSKEDALGLLRQRIRSYNDATGVANTATSGYHESITRFYVWVIAKFLERADRSRSEDELAAELVDAFGSKTLPLAYWTKERLFSVEARADWVEPDIRALE